MPFSRPLNVAALVCVLLSSPALAQETAVPVVAPDAQIGAPEKDGFELRLGAGVLAVPNYLGSKTYMAQPVPYIDATYDDLAALSYQDGLTLNAVNVDGFTAGPVARVRFGQNESDNRKVLHGLGNVGTSVGLGGFLTYEFGPFNVRSVTTQDVANGSKGLESEFSATYTTTVRDSTVGPWLLATGPSLTVVDAQYNRSYFGISPKQSLRSGRPEFRPGGGLEGVGDTVTFIVPITDNIAVTSLAGYSRLLSDATRSPIVRNGVGSANQFTAGLFLTYQIF